MKQFVFTAALMLMSVSAILAQTEKGRWTVGAQVGNVSYASRGTERSLSVLLSPSVGVFAARNFLLGLSLPVVYSQYRSTVVSTYESSNTQLGVSPFARIYFGSAKLRPFVNASVGYNHQWTSFLSPGSSTGRPVKDDSGFIGYSLSAGGAYFINNTISLDASLGYAGGDTNNLNIADFFNSGTTQAKSFGLSIGFRLFLGK